MSPLTRAEAAPEPGLYSSERCLRCRSVCTYRPWVSEVTFRDQLVAVFTADERQDVDSNL